MEEMQKIAEAYYNAAPDSSKKVADDFISEMDENGDGNITLSQFLNFSRKKNYSYISNPHFFKELNLNGTGTLDRREAMTLFYIVVSGRPTCIGCGKLITTIFFSCVRCFNAGNGSPTFDLCSSCFCAGSYNCHEHNEFLDNFVLLQMKRQDEKQRFKEVNNNHQEAISSSQEIVLATRNPHVEMMWQAAIQGIAIVGARIAQSFCTIM